MIELAEIFEKIDKAELQLRDKQFKDALETYRDVLKELQTPEGSLGNNLSGDDVKNAMGLLHEDIRKKIEEIEKLQQNSQQRKVFLQNKSSSAISGDASLLSNLDTVRSLNINSTVSEPLLISALNSFQSHLMTILENELDATKDTSAIELRVVQEINQLKKDVCMLEQKKWKEYDIKTDHLIKENKKLSNQIVKLKERWHSLVESAKQKRNQQQD